MILPDIALKIVLSESLILLSFDFEDHTVDYRPTREHKREYVLLRIKVTGVKYFGSFWLGIYSSCLLGRLRNHFLI